MVNDYHLRMTYAGCYTILAQLRKDVHIPQAFVTVEKILKECVIYRKQNARTVGLNQSFYKDFHKDPSPVPYRDIFVADGNKKQKVWVLCITCLWSQAINLKVCSDLTVSEFLRTLQMHIFEYGLPGRVFSDLGTQLVEGASIITDYLKDVTTQLYLEEDNIKTPQFHQFFKENKALGSLVEACVKISKKILYGALGKNVLPHLQFELLIAQTVSIINKRPVPFKECLQDGRPSNTDFPVPITPELLVKGYNLPR